MKAVHCVRATDWSGLGLPRAHVPSKHFVTTHCVASCSSLFFISIRNFEFRPPPPRTCTPFRTQSRSLSRCYSHRKAVPVGAATYLDISPYVIRGNGDKDLRAVSRTRADACAVVTDSIFVVPLKSPAVHRFDPPVSNRAHRQVRR